MTAAVNVLLADGTVVRVHEITADDLAQVAVLYSAMSEHDRYLRFFTPSRRTAEAYLAKLAAGPDVRFGGLFATLDGRTVGTATYHVLADPAEAEIALVVAGPAQHRGVGTLLLEHLGALALRRGIRRFRAELLAENHAMLRVLRDCGLPVDVHQDGTVLDVRLELRPDEHYRDAVLDRDRCANRASLRHVFAPASVAVVGASRRHDSVGNAVLRSLQEGGFTGAVWPVNPHAGTVNGLRCHPSVGALPRAPELAVVCTPAATVPEVVRDCGRRGTRAVLVLTAGITEDPALATALRAAVAEHGLRLVGPNCLGLANTDPAVRLQAHFAGRSWPPGPVGVVAQSGGVAIAVADRLAALGTGVSTAVSTGDKYDLSGNDLLQWWAEDNRTRIAVLYLESFGNPRKFSRLARRLATELPVLAVRTGSSAAAVRAAASHTAAGATPAVLRDALYRQAGIIAVDDLGELTEALVLLDGRPLPAGAGLAVVGNAGGIGVLAADAAARAGLELSPLSEITRAALVALLPGSAAVGNPVDTTAAVSAEVFTDCLRVVLADAAVHAVLAACVPTALGDPGEAVAAVAEEAARRGKPLLLVRPGQAEAVTGGAVPAYADPATATRALGHAVRYAAWRRRDPGRVPELPGIEPERGRAVVTSVLAGAPEGRWLSDGETAELVRAFGIPLVDSAVAADAAAAVALADRLGYPVVLKAVVPGLVHRSDEHAVRLDLADPAQVRAEFADLARRFQGRLHGVLVQPMVRAGVELIAGVATDPSFGPLVVCGLGGVGTDLLADRAHRLVPLTDADAAEMTAQLRTAPLLTGYRGSAPVDLAAVHEVLLRLARLAELVPEVAELDLNPVLARPDGCVAVDARVRVAPSRSADPYLRRLRT
ncbi:acyl-CoA synthetase (NDP forming)/RimJ/RimL family protein N-acetyltransferase [Crossiella equi]|uniref:Acyl-CoA synthetase (NDP forming)/RimJ/RimL family protein N-acetyltransferase n=1 Tax=Crossiella equi TaxID=130796 RepID=A0ABS5A6F9_9PSEU|nr:bifunctional GNAT family N-acetyltransferase/acetate--CoA ligase family protein [Crossiella equi]MBP2471837.1 acyl-CoA synthetase (NDP forming)/RimJ/RimL family protein N-acetyltransferase [Crossiella equi]